MAVVRDPVLGVTTTVLPCRSCGQLVYFSLSTQKRRVPFEVDVVDDRLFPTRTNHFSKCPDAKVWRKRK